MQLHSWLTSVSRWAHFQLMQTSTLKERKNGHMAYLISLSFTLSSSKIIHSIILIEIGLARHFLIPRFCWGWTRLHFQTAWWSVLVGSLTVASSHYPSTVETKFKLKSSLFAGNNLMAIMGMTLHMWFVKFEHTCALCCLISLESVWPTQLLTLEPSQPV